MENAHPYSDLSNRCSSHHLIASMLAHLSEGSRILDVGVASGILRRFCIGLGYVQRGIEPNFDWVGKARFLYANIFEGSLEQAPDPFLVGHDDLVCGDVFDHLHHLEEQLGRLAKSQHDDCIFIISMPNLANLWVRLNLLLGRSDYAGRGILDRTHLHFYTRTTFLELVKNVGLEIKSLKVTQIPLELIPPFFERNYFGRWLYAIFAWITDKLPTVFGYQWITEAIFSNNL
jgi:hypothetical protein